MLDTNIIVIETWAVATTPAPPKPRVRFRDYRCAHCGRLLMRSSLDTIGLALPRDFQRDNPLLAAALKAVVCEIRCPKCSVTNTYKPME
jgi:phage FluMu protein Com